MFENSKMIWRILKNDRYSNHGKLVRETPNVRCRRNMWPPKILVVQSIKIKYLHFVVYYVNRMRNILKFDDEATSSLTTIIHIKSVDIANKTIQTMGGVYASAVTTTTPKKNLKNIITILSDFESSNELFMWSIIEPNITNCTHKSFTFTSCHHISFRISFRICDNSLTCLYKFTLWYTYLLKLFNFKSQFLQLIILFWLLNEPHRLDNSRNPNLYEVHNLSNACTFSIMKLIICKSNFNRIKT